jgi:hypothetical protein
MRGYKVTGMILLQELKGTTRLDRGKYISVHVPTRTNCFEAVALIKFICFYTSTQKISEQGMNIKFCVKLGKNASGICPLPSV